MDFAKAMVDTLGTARDSWLDALGIRNPAKNPELDWMEEVAGPNFGWLGMSDTSQPSLSSSAFSQMGLDRLLEKLPTSLAGAQRFSQPSKPSASAPKPVTSKMPEAAAPAALVAPVSGGGGAGVLQWKPLVSDTAAKYGVPQDVALGIMEIESGGNPEAQGAKTQWGKAQGLMQVMPFHWSPGTPEETMRDPAENIDKGMQILKRGFDRFGDWEKAAAAYFGAVDANGNITDASDGNTTGSVYVRKFNEARSKYFAPEEE